MAKQATAPEADQIPDNSMQVLIDQLQQQLAVATSESGQLKGQIISLTADRDTLADANVKLQGELETKTSELAEAEAIIEEQTARLKEAEVGQKLGPVIVTHEQQQYRVLAPKFQHHGLDVDAHTLKQNPALVAELVEGGSGLLQKVEAA